MNHLPGDQYFCVKSLTCYNLLFQTSDEKIAIGMNLIREADIKVESEEFCDANDDQPYYDGMRWIIIICLSTILILYRFYC